MVRKVLLASVFAISAIHSAAAEESLVARIERMEQEIKILKEQAANAEAKAAAAEAKTHAVKPSDNTAMASSSGNAAMEYGNKGLKVSSANGDAWFSLRGLVQIDGRFYVDDEADNGLDKFLSRRLRPIFSGGYQDFSFRLMPDFAGSELRLLDAHIDYKFADPLQFRFGKFKSPLSLERLQSSSDLVFVERGLPSNLAPSRDFGLIAYGEMLNESLEYQLGVLNGDPDLSSDDTDDDDNKDIVARVFAKPFKGTNMEALKGLGIGIAGSVGEREGDLDEPELASYSTAGQLRFFTHAADAFADGTQWRIYPQANYYYGSFGALAEYAISSEEVSNGAVSDRLQNDAWQAYISYVLTGENASFSGIKPRRNFDWRGGDWGAFEIAARIGELSIDRDAFPLLATATSVLEAQSFGFGLNWYLNPHVKWQAGYDFTEFSGGAARSDENALFTRIQYQF